MAANQTSPDAAQANHVAERFGIDRDLIQQTMQRVQSGELTPAEATSVLLPDQRPSPAAQNASSPQGESLALLTQRLGVPPIDIVDNWCAQMRITAAVHHSQSNQPLPPIDMHQWELKSSGQLLWNGRSYLTAVDSIDSDMIDAQSLRHIQQFRDSLLTSPLSGDSATQSSPMSVATKPGDLETRQSKRRQRESPIRRVVYSGLIGLSLIAIAALVYQASRPGAANKDSVADREKPNIFDPAVNDQVVSSNTDPRSDDIQPRTGELETFADAASDAPMDAVVIADRGSIDKEDFLSLDSLMPAAEGFDAKDFDSAADNSTAASDTADKSGGSDNGNMAAETDIAALDVMGDDDKAAPEESPQQIRASKIMSVQLPAISDVDQAIELWPTAMNSCQLDFPFPVPLQLRDQDAGLEIIEERKQAAIANITSDAGGTLFNWTPLASKISASSALAHGRLTVASGDVVYLRPTIEADLWPLDLERPDVRPTWDLTAPIPPRVTRLSIDFQLPDEVEFGWIEPVDPTSVRRARGVAVLTAKDDESVSLGVRLDIRCSRKLSCRVRYAARIDADTPWHVVSRPMLEQTADNLVAKSELISKQNTQMSAIYSQAGTDERRVLRPQRDALEKQSESLQKMSEGVAKLQSLVSHIEAAAGLKLRVWVEWPDGEQTLLNMK